MPRAARKAIVRGLLAQQRGVVAAVQSVQANRKPLQREAHFKEAQQKRQEACVKDIAFMLYVFACVCSLLALAFVPQ